METYLVESTSLTGAHETTRHYSAEAASIEVMVRMRRGHSAIQTNVAGADAVVYAALDRNTATKPLRKKTA